MMPPVELLFGPQRRRWLLATVLLLTFFSSWSSVLRLRELVDAGDVDAAAEGESLLTLAERNMLVHLPQRAGEAPRLPARPLCPHHLAARLNQGQQLALGQLGLRPAYFYESPLAGRKVGLNAGGQDLVQGGPAATGGAAAGAGGGGAAQQQRPKQQAQQQQQQAEQKEQWVPETVTVGECIMHKNTE